MNIYCKFIDKLQVIMKPVHYLLQGKDKIHWNEKLRNVVPTTGVTYITKYVFQKLHRSSNHLHCRLLFKWHRLFPFPKNIKGKLDNICYKSCFFTTTERKLCTTYRERIGRV